MYHKHKVRLRRVLAGILSAAMIFTTDGQVLLAVSQPPADSAEPMTTFAELSDGDAQMPTSVVSAFAEDTLVSEVTPILNL